MQQAQRRAESATDELRVVRVEGQAERVRMVRGVGGRGNRQSRCFGRGLIGWKKKGWPARGVREQGMGDRQGGCMCEGAGRAGVGAEERWACIRRVVQVKGKRLHGWGDWATERGQPCCPCSSSLSALHCSRHLVTSPCLWVPPHDMPLLLAGAARE